MSRIHVLTKWVKVQSLEILSLTFSDSRNIFQEHRLAKAYVCEMQMNNNQRGNMVKNILSFTYFNSYLKCQKISLIFRPSIREIKRSQKINFSSIHEF